MFILGIQGSPRGKRSRTRLLMEWVLAGAKEAGADVKIVNCSEYEIIPCNACDACTKTGICVHQDDFSDIFDLLRSVDGLVLGSPVYIDHVSGQIKILIDRLADAIHNQILGGKYGCSIATTYVSGGKEVVSYLNHVINYLGAIAIEGLYAALEDDPDTITKYEPAARDLGRSLVMAIRDKPGDHIQESEILDNIAFFKDIIEKNKFTRPDDYQRWVRMGWI
jgi:multimeric flavodoxin WrbA